MHPRNRTIAPSSSSAPTGRRLGAGMASALLVGLLAACSSTPLPPWDQGPAVQAAQVHRLPPGQAMPMGVQGEAGAYSPAVAARFAEPAVRYATPGLQQGREQFTSNEEIQTFLGQLAARPVAGVAAQPLVIGRSQAGAPIHALLVGKGVTLDPAGFARSGKPTVLFIGQQHGNEPAAGEALLVAAEQLLNGQWASALNQLNVIIVPRANPDGALAGRRALGNDIDLNRDHLLLRTPEARALAQLVRDYRPLVIVDSHEFSVMGRVQQKFQLVQAYDAMLQYANTPNIGDFTIKAANEWFVQPMFQELKRHDLRAQWYFTTSSDMQDQSLSMGGIRPDTGRNVNGLKNAVSLLIETRGVGIGRHHIQRRVHTHVVLARKVLEQAAVRASHLQQVKSYVEREAASSACSGQVVIEAAQTQEHKEVLLLDPNTGADVARRLPWKSSLQLQSARQRNRPCGYLLAHSEGDAVARLQMLGVNVLRVAEAGDLQVERYQETAREQGQRQDVLGPMGSEAQILRVQVQLARERVTVPAGSYYVPMGQPLANLAIAALEPDTQNSYFANRIQHDLGSLVRVVEPPTLVFEEVE
ncbi:peptidase M14 [Vandammella animalimorsus]|uniref:Peptidase M14 n=1 Tax=Vandammella animalimorsus TaxID=2029117 RepID=A0A3M6RK47_9BURK|nr:M14 family metallopeptidase [Vandammella animalimorsus]RMX14934.1 peptidase M14 [Vandammella animalimorsus]